MKMATLVRSSTSAAAVTASSSSGKRASVTGLPDVRDARRVTRALDGIRRCWANEQRIRLARMKPKPHRFSRRALLTPCLNKLAPGRCLDSARLVSTA
jgi:hypothetical protein